MKAFARIFALIIFVGAALAGGCSLIFSSVALQSLFYEFDLTVFFTWISGFGAAALLIWLGVLLWRSGD